MAKERTPFERTAAALKIMGKKIAAKKTESRHELQCVWIENHSGYAVATDGHVLACLNLKWWDSQLSRVEMLPELAFFADMQVIQYVNGAALISADKKDEFVKAFGHGMTITPDYDGPDIETRIPYPDWRRLIPAAESLQHVSKTGATFYPGQLGVLDLLPPAFDVVVNDSHTISNKLYGVHADGAHVAVYPGLLLMAIPLKYSEEYVSCVPSKEDIESFFKTAKPDQVEMELNTNE